MMNELDPLASFAPFFSSNIHSIAQSISQSNNSPFSLSSLDDTLFDESNTIDQLQPIKQQDKEPTRSSISNEALLLKASASSTKQSPIPTQQSPTVMSRCKGNSCHQCKTTKESSQLYFCTARTEGPGNQTNGQPNNLLSNQSKRCCRKKYCLACMSRWYKSLLHTGEPGVDPSVNPAIYQSEEQGWLCPSCIGHCVCAACDRKKEKAAAKSQSNKQLAEQAMKYSSKQPLHHQLFNPATIPTFSQPLNQTFNQSINQKRLRSLLTPTMSGTNSPLLKTIKTEDMTFEQSISRSINQLHRQLNQTDQQSNNQSNNQPNNQSGNSSIKLESISELHYQPPYGPRQTTDPSINQTINLLGRPPLVSRSASANPPVHPSNDRSWTNPAISALNAYYQSINQPGNQSIQQTMDQSGALSLLIEAQRASLHHQQFIQNAAKRSGGEQLFMSTNNQSINQSNNQLVKQSNHQFNNTVKREPHSQRSNSISSLSSGDQSVNQYYHSANQSSNHSVHSATPPMTAFSSGSSQVSTPKTYNQSFNESINQSIYDVGGMTLSHKTTLESVRSIEQSINQNDRQSYNHMINQSINSMNQPVPTIGQLFGSFSALATPLGSMPNSPKHQSFNQTINQSLDSDPFHPSSLYHADLDCSLNQSINQFDSDDLCGDWPSRAGGSHDWIFSNQ